jgi:hypothetical protein
MLLLLTLAACLGGHPTFDEWCSNRDACKQFLLASDAVISAAQSIKAIAAVTHATHARADPTSDFARQPRWSSFEDPSYLPATVVDTREHIDRVLNGEFDASPAELSLAHGLPSALLSAVRWTASNGAEAANLRADIGTSFISIVTSHAITTANNVAFAQFSNNHVRSHCTKRVGGWPNAAAAAACTLAFGLSDVNYCAELVVGMLASCAEDTGNWKLKERVPTVQLSHSYCQEKNAQLISDLESASAGTADTECYQKTLDECDAGLMDGPFTYDQLRDRFGEDFLLHKRFGVIQNGEVRPCDDASLSGFNDATRLAESLRCIAADWPARVTAAFAELLPFDGSWFPQLATDDVAKAFRQVSCAQPWYTPVALRNPHTGTVEFFTLGGFNFGLAAAPVQFNRVTHHATLVAQRLFGATCGYYYDDIPSLDPSFVLHTTEDRGDAQFSDAARERYPHYYHLFGTFRGSSQWCIGLVAFLIGYPLAQKKRLPYGTVRKFLGVISDFRHFAEKGVVRMYVDAERVAKLTLIITAILASNDISGAAASRLAGKLSFATMWTAWRFGRAALQPLFARAQRAGRSALSACLKVTLIFFLSTLPLLPEHVVHIYTDQHSSTTKRAYVWTDACWSPYSLLRPAGLGIVLLLPACYIDGIFHAAKWYYAEANCPSDFIENFCLRREQRIGELELLAAVCAYLTFAAQLRGRHVTHWIDNTGALAALIKGYARAADLAKIVHAFAATNLALQCWCWFEYVRSAANISDGPSRGDFTLCEELGATKVDLVIPPPEWWDAPTSIFHAATIAADRHASSGLSKRHRPAPSQTDPSDARPRRRTRARAARSTTPVHVVLAGSPEERALQLPPASIVDVDITRNGPFGNPFPLGIFDGNNHRRREVVSLHERWLNHRPAIEAGDLTLADGSPLGPTTRPRSRFWSERTALDVLSAFENLTRSNRNARAFRLVCSRSCRNRLCHGTAVAAELRAFLCAECV